MDEKTDPQDAYKRAQAYKGTARVLRLVLIAKRFPEMKAKVIPEVMEELKATGNALCWQQLVRDSKEMAEEWPWPDFESVLKDISGEIEGLNRKIEQARNNVEDSIKADIAAGNYMMQHGVYTQAARKFMAAQDRMHQAQPSARSIEVAKKLLLCFIGDHVKFRPVEAEVRYLNDTQLFPSEEYRVRQKACLKAGGALVAMVTGEFREAANGFCDSSCTIALGNHFSEAILPEDVAMYGGICALAAFSRTELRQKVIENDNFKDFLDSVPAVKDLVDNFYGSDYAACMDVLERLKPTLELDPNLERHLSKLYDQIVNKMMVQYFRPYAKADMNHMASAFNMSLDELEARVSQLIVQHKISARIDSQNKVMIARHADERAVTFDKVLANGQSFVVDVRTAMLRMSLRENSMVIKRPRSEHGGSRRGGGGGFGIGRTRFSGGW